MKTFLHLPNTIDLHHLQKFRKVWIQSNLKKSEKLLSEHENETSPHACTAKYPYFFLRNFYADLETVIFILDKNLK